MIRLKDAIGSSGNSPGRARTRPRLFRRTIRALSATILALVLALGPTAAAGANGHTLITSSSVGPALLGSTLAQLEAQLGPGYEISAPHPIIVDGTGVTISRYGKTLFHAIGGFGSGLGASTRLTLFIIEGTDYRTAAGIGPGSLVASGESVYGDATLSYNHETESREFVRYANHPAPRLHFRTGSGPEAGIYPPGGGPLFETTEYHAGADIDSVWISCTPAAGDCPVIGALPITGATTWNLTGLGVMFIVVGAATLGLADRRLGNEHVRVGIVSAVPAPQVRRERRNFRWPKR